MASITVPARQRKVDLETVQIDDVFTLLQCNDQGLTGEEATRRLAIFGPNKLVRRAAPLLPDT